MARNLRKFTIEAEYSAATLNYPSVSWVTDTDIVHFDKTPPAPPALKYKLTLSDSSTVSAECDSTSALTESEVSIPYKNTIVEAEIGNCVTSIGTWTFDSCTGLTSVTIPDSVTAFGMGAFNSCRSLTSVHIPNCITTIESMVFYDCRSITSVTIPNAVTSIGDSSFGGCSRLTSVTIPDSVTSIGSQTFNNCTSLTSVTISNAVTSISYNAFFGCSGLTSVTIPNSVTNIEWGAFQGCSSLTSITINAATPPTLGTDAFNGSTCPIYVPAESVETYKTASGWSTYASRIQAIV